MDHGQRLGRAAPFLLLRRLRITQRLKPQAIHPAPGQCRRDQAKQANCQAQQPEGYRHGLGTDWGWLFMIAPWGREVGNLSVQNYRWHLLTRPSFQQPLQSPLLDVDGPARFEVLVSRTGLLNRKRGPWLK